MPMFIKNLISFFSLTKCNYSIYFNKSVFIRKNNSFICSSPLVDNLFHITLISIFSVVENHHVSLKRKMPNQTYLWHLHFDHKNLNRIKRLVKSRTLYLVVLEDLPVYKSYIEGKMTKNPFTTKRVKAKECLELMHIEVFKSFHV